MKYMAIIALSTVFVATFMLRNTGNSSRSIPSSIIGFPVVSDGDTLRFDKVIGYGKVRIRLQGIDAPESKQECRKNNISYACGIVSRDALIEFIGDNDVTCVSEGADRYKRMIGRCSVAGRDIGQFMVASGHAVAYRRYDKTYIIAEDYARNNRLGIWSGMFVFPEKWRRGKRLPK